MAVSALTGAGIEGLSEAILARLDYRAAEPGQAVPFTREQAEAMERGRQFLEDGRLDDARQALAPLTNVRG